MINENSIKECRFTKINGVPKKLTLTTIELEENPNKCGVCGNRKEVIPFGFIFNGKAKYCGYYICDSCVKLIASLELKHFHIKSIYGNILKINID